MYKLSVLIPVYKVEKYVEKCLRSVLTNSIIEDCEVVIINDCSPDNSINVINCLIDSDFSELRRNIKIINNSENLGISSTRNVLLNNATGEYIIFVDSDDWVEQDFFEKMYNAAINNNADIVGCNLINEFPDGRATKRRVQLFDNGKECIKSWIMGNLPSWLWIKCFRRQFILENNLYFEPNLNYGEDTLFMVQYFAYCKKITFLDEYLYHYLRRDNSISGGIRNYEKSCQIVKSQTKIENFIQKNYPTDKEMLELFNISKIEKKRWIIITGTKKSQKAFMGLWPEINHCLNKMDVSKSQKIILKNENKILARLLLKLITLKKILKNKKYLRLYLEK